NRLAQISTSVARYFSSEYVDKNLLKQVQDIALTAAAHHSTEALNACMLFHLKSKNQKAVLDLYQKLIGKMQDQETLDEATTGEIARKGGEEDGSWLASDSLAFNVLPVHKVPPNSGRVDILLAVTAAHGTIDSLQEAFKTYLN